MEKSGISKRFQSHGVYQIYVRSFYDANGDGIGDLKGVLLKLPYIASLGVGYIWLNPIFPSPQNDNGYDISDYCSVDPVFGTMEDLKLLIEEAKAYGIGIILDMVFNHTSTSHPWFQKAMAGEQRYKDYYFFRKGRAGGQPPTNWISKFGGSAWAPGSEPDEYYLHLFDVTQADLNWENQSVREELFDILRFWKEKGIEGFRLDVINLISKPEHFEDDPIGDGRRFYTDGPKVEEYFREIRRVADEGRKEELLLVGELSSTSPDKCVRYSGGNTGELSMVFHFQHLKVDYPAENDKWTLGGIDFSALRNLLNDWQEYMCEHNAWDALFWNNHDQPRAVTRFASAKKEYYYQSATMLAATIHFMRGTPYIYMGEEIGMVNPEFEDIKDYRDVETLNYYHILKKRGLSEQQVMEVIKKRSRDNSRTPMQWNSSQHAGFTKGVPWIKAADNKSAINVELEEKKGSGILAFYRRLLSLRKEYEIIQSGTYRPFMAEAENLVAYVREDEVQYLLCLNNYSEGNLCIPAGSLKQYQGLEARVLISNYSFTDIRLSRDLVLQPYETVAVLLQK